MPNLSIEALDRERESFEMRGVIEAGERLTLEPPRRQEGFRWFNPLACAVWVRRGDDPTPALGVYITAELGGTALTIADTPSSSMEPWLHPHYKECAHAVMWGCIALVAVEERELWHSMLRMHFSLGANYREPGDAASIYVKVWGHELQPRSSAFCR